MLPNFRPEIPISFIEGYQMGYTQYTELQARYSVAIEDIVRLAFEKGESPLNSRQEAVLYTLDGNISDAGGDDDYAHRLFVSFQAAARRPTSEDLPSDALTPNVYDPARTVTAIRKQAKYGAYITGIAMQRSIPMRKLREDAISLDARNETQLVRCLTEGGERRYAIPPKGGALTIVQKLPEFSSLVDQAYDTVVLYTSSLVAEQQMTTSYNHAIEEDNKNPGGIIDNIPRFTRESSDTANVGPRIRNLVKAIEASREGLGAELMGQLMADNIHHIASLAILNSSAYYEKERGRVSFDYRLQWVAENANAFRTTLSAFINGHATEFHTSLEEKLEPARTIVQQTEAIAADLQPPKATYPDGTVWKVARAL